MAKRPPTRSSNKIIRVFISCPSDLEEEAGEIIALLDQFKTGFESSYSVSLTPLYWKSTVGGGPGRPQKVIFDQIGDYDIYIGMMWKRFGTPTEKAESGTEEEFKAAYRKWKKDKKPRMLFFFCERPFYPSSLEEVEQVRKVLSFRKDMSKHGIWPRFTSIDEFRRLIQRELLRVVLEQTKNLLAD